MRPTRRFPSQPVTVFASGARTATAESEVFDGIPSQYRGVLLVLDVTAATTGTVTLNVQDSDGDEWTTRLASAAVTDVGSTFLLLHPSAPTDRANSVEKTSLGYQWRVEAEKSDATAKTFSVTAFYLA